MGYSYLYPPLKKGAFSKAKKKKPFKEESVKPHFFHDDEDDADYEYVSGDEDSGGFVGGFVPSETFPPLPNSIGPGHFPKVIPGGTALNAFNVLKTSIYRDTTMRISHRRPKKISR